MTESDLTNPEPEFVQEVYGTFVEVLAGTTKEELHQQQFVGIGELEFPELHEDSIPRLALFRATADLLESSGCSGFRMSHMLAPKYKVFRSHLSALINFAKFREERAVTYTQFTTETDKLMEEKTQLEEKLNDLKQKVEQLRSEKEIKMPEIKALQKASASLESEISSLNKQQAMLRHTHEKMKKMCKELKTQETTAKQQQEEVEIECERLRSQIVHSPGRFEQEVKHLQTLLMEEKTECAVLEKRRRNMQDRLATFTREQERVQKTMQVLRDLSGHMNSRKKVGEAKENLESKITLQKAEIKDLQTLKQHLKRQLKRHEERTCDIRQQQTVKNEAARQALAAAKADLSNAMERLNLMDSETERVKREIEATKLAIESESKVHRETMESRRELFESLVTKVQKYNEGILGSISAM